MTAVTMGFVRICFFVMGDVGHDAVTILDYVAIGLAACLMLWTATVLLAPKS